MKETTMPDLTILSKYRISVFLLAWFSTTPAWANVTFQFDYSFDTNGFFGEGTAARATLEAAGDYYESILEDDLAPIWAGGTYRTWKARFADPSSGEIREVANPYVPADTLVIYVGSRELGNEADSMQETLGQSSPGSSWTSGYASWIDGVTSRGEGLTQGAEANDFGPWGGSMSIDSDTNWNLDYQTAPSAEQSDLYSVILHELAHVLGFGTSDSWNNLIEEDQFTGAASDEQHGGNVPLSGTAHWAQSTSSVTFPEGDPQETMMDPDLTKGTRVVPTFLDLAGLVDVGWDITLVPVSEEALPGDTGVESIGLMSVEGVTVPCLADMEVDRVVSGGSNIGLTVGEQVETFTPAAVPEPSMAVLLLAMGWTLLFRRIFR